MICSDKEFASVLGIYEFRTHVAYNTYSFRALKTIFKGYVPQELEDASFEPIETCRRIERTPRDLDLDFIHLGCRAHSREILDEMARRNMRPIMETEFLSFVFTYWHVPLLFKLVALGSYVRLDGESHALHAYTTDGEHCSLFLVDYDGPFDATCRFPAVPI
jgi:hypothetical protein